MEPLYMAGMWWLAPLVILLAVAYVVLRSIGGEIGALVGVLALAVAGGLWLFVALRREPAG